MSERYSKLFSLPGVLYSSGSPVVIAAGALLKDNQTGRVIAQLKIQNISPNSIKAVKVSIRPFDITGNPLGENIEYMYLDFKASRDEYFGQKIPVVLPDDTTRSFSVDVTEVVFTNNSLWQGAAQLQEKLPSTVPLVSYLKNTELIRQYRIKFGPNSGYKPMVWKDLWYCTCGALNHAEESVCHLCRNNVVSLMNVDINALKQERDDRVAMEQKRAAEARAVADARIKKIALLVPIVTAVICALIVLTTILNNA